jgi:hypothetical protein
MSKNTKSHREKKNPQSRDAWLREKKENSVNKAPIGKIHDCQCGFTTHDIRKVKKHRCSFCSC